MEADGSSSMKRLCCSVKNYDWGLIGRESRVARLLLLNRGLDVEESRLYDEFWMDTHESGPSFLVETLENGASMAEISESLSLKSWIEENPSDLGVKLQNSI